MRKPSAACVRSFLGLRDGAPRFAMRFDPGRREEMEAGGLFVSDLRSIAVAGQLPPGDLAAIACGKAMLAWHGRHRFCSNCGTEARIVEGGWRRDCPSCGAQHFPRTDPVVIMLAHRGDLCLMGRQPHFAPGMWSCLAGFVEPGETAEEAVRREVMEEAGIATGRVTYHSCQPWPFPMSLMIGCLAEATSDEIVMDAKELEGRALVHPPRDGAHAHPHPSRRPVRAAAGGHRPSPRPGLRGRHLEHFRAKWEPVRVKEMRENKEIDPFSVSMKR